MNKSELIMAMSRKTGLSKADAEGALAAFTSIVQEELTAKRKVLLIGFGTFDVAERPPRTGKNPKTGDQVFIRKSTVPKFKPGKALKTAVNGR